MLEPLEFLVSALFGTVALIFVIEVVELLVAAFKRRPASGPPTYYSAGFSLRRTDSTLRRRHVHNIRPQGRLTELNKYQDDPYAP